MILVVFLCHGSSGGGSRAKAKELREFYCLLYKTLLLFGEFWDLMLSLCNLLKLVNHKHD
jgi:hypothetical protein